MNGFLQALWVNCIAASLLALGVFILSRCWRRPAVIHLLWLVVLARLVMPPVVEWPAFSFPEFLTSSSPETPPGRSDTDLDTQLGPAAPPAPALDPVISPPGFAAEGSATTSEVRRRSTVSRPWVLGGAWLAGTIALAGIALLRSWRFHRAILNSPHAPPAVQREAERIAEQLGIRAPQVILLGRTVSPVLWGAFGRLAIVLPSALVAEMPMERIRTLLAHELAHCRRRDHWVRWFELAVGCAYWWHPVVWWAHRELRRAEEQCCDEWVVRMLPEYRREYGAALLDTVDFLAAAPARLPAVGSGMAGAASFKRRLLGILAGQEHRVSFGGRLLTILCGLVLLTVMPTCSPQKPVANEPDASAADDGTVRPVPVSTPPAKELSPECEKLLAKMRQHAAGVPEVFFAPKRSWEEIDSDAQATIETARQILDKCGAGVGGGEVEATLARMLLARYNRFTTALPKTLRPADRQIRISAYLAEIESLLQTAIKHSANNSAVEQSARYLSVTVADRRGKPTDVRRRGNDLLKKYPKFERAANVRLAIGKSMTAEGQYKDAVQYFKRVIAEHGDEPEYVFYMRNLQEAYHGVGDVKGLERIARQMVAEFPSRLAKVKDPRIQQHYRNNLDISEFWIGFARLCQGDPTGARSFFMKQIERANKREAELRTNGKGLEPVVRIYRDFRSRAYVQFIDERAGQPVGADLQKIRWLSASGLSLSESLGKVIIVVFRQVNSARSSGFLQAVDRLVRERTSDGLRGANLGFVAGDSAERTKQTETATRDQIAALGLTMPVGLDPDGKEQATYRSFGIGPGSAHCLVFDRRGRYAWKIDDPRDRDVNVLRAVVDRLLGE